MASSRDSACPLARPRARIRPSVPRPSLPAPARAARAGAGRWRRFCCRPRGAIRRPPPGDPARGGGSPELAPGLSLAGLRHPRKFVPLLSAGSPAATRTPDRPLELQVPPDYSSPTIRVSLTALLVWPGPKCRMGLPIRGPVAARTDTAPLIWGQDTS